MNNSLEITYRHSNDLDNEGKLSSRDSVIFSREDVRLYSSNGGSHSIVYSRENKVDMFGAIYLYNNKPDKKGSVHNLKHITLLPIGFEFVPNSSHYGFATYGRDTQGLPIEYEVVENYKNTGRTAVIHNYDYIEYNKHIWTKFQIEPTLYATE